MILIKEKSINRKVIVGLSVAILIIAIIAIAYLGKVQNIFRIGNNAKQDALPNFAIESKDGDLVVVTFRDENGIKEIRYPNYTEVLDCGGKKQVGIDFHVEPDETYTFRVTDVNGTTRNESFITPSAHIEVTKNDIQIDLNEFKTAVTRKINGNLIATNFAVVKVGDQNYVDSQTTEMSEVFSHWTKFGTGDWHYLAGSNQVVDYANSTRYTGYYFPGGDYDDIVLEFSAMTTSNDDDIIGAMIRFNANSNGTHSSYLFLMDRHDMNSGINNGAHNGINRILNINLADRGDNSHSGIVKLAGNANIRWTRNSWQKYKFVAKGDKIQAYVNDVLKAEATDTSISSGTYGFLTYSQDHTYFKDIVIKTDKFYTLGELLSNIEWIPQDVNIVINLNNSSESSLYDSTTADTFVDNDIYYIAVSNEDNKPAITQFITNINENGIWVDSSVYESYIEQVANYISTLLKSQ